jgi:hypothetical protein
MKKFLNTAFAAVIAVTGVAATSSIASAGPSMPVVAAPASNLIQVQGDGRWGGRGGEEMLRRKWRNGGDYRRGGFYVQNGRGWYNGHRGYRNYRNGYRRHGDWWFPAGAFIAGAIIGGALADPGPTYYEPRPVYRRVYRGYSNAHVQWCFDRYRSYRAYDNTFQPYHGPRQQCYSPYN